MSNQVVVVRKTETGYMVLNVDKNKKAGFSHYITQSMGKSIIKDVQDKTVNSLNTLDMAIDAIKQMNTTDRKIVRSMAEVLA